MGAEADELAAHLAVPVETYDERLTTVTAERSLMEQDLRGPRRRQLVDMVAAAVMLQAWLDSRRGGGGVPEAEDG
jgi:putative Holliday junction resolvase